jgi:hypothetical protein
MKNFMQEDTYGIRWKYMVQTGDKTSVWNNQAPDSPRRIDSAAGEHISSPRRVKISSEKNLEVLNLLMVMVTKFSGLVTHWQG